jgi:glycosyltransferase 2 family protein
MNKKQLILAAKLIISLALVVYMYTQIAPKWRESADLLHMAVTSKIGYVLAALAAFSMLNIVCIIRWKLLLDAQKVGFSFKLAGRLFLISLFFSQCVPGGMAGGEVARIYYVTKLAGDRKQEAVAVTLMDRFCGMMGLAMILVLAAFFIEDPRLKKWCLYIICTSAAALVMVGLFFSKRVLGRIPFGQKIFEKLPYKEGLKRIYNAYNRFSHNKIRLAVALLLAGVVHFFLVVSAWLFGKALGLEAGFQQHLILMPLVTALRAIPISPVGDIGTAEVAFIKIYGLLPAADGVSTGIFIALAFLMRAAYLIWAVLGWVIYVRFRSRVPGMSLKEISGTEQLVEAE